MHHSKKSLPTGTGWLAAAVVAGATALWVAARARRAAREHPPRGKMLNVDGVRLHYVMRGEGRPVVLLHGNVVTLDDFHASGLIDSLARNHRVVAFDRPGYGHSDRPHDRDWTPAAQAQLLQRACAALGLERPVVVGHSMGALVAVMMGLNFPFKVGGLVLLGGYYFPTVRWDAMMTAPVAWPVVGGVLRHTVTAITARALIERTIQAMFAPDPVPKGFLQTVPRELLVRPSQLRANAEDARFMMSQARAAARRYGELRLPVTLIAGTADPVVDLEAHAERLHRALPQSTLVTLQGTGHMSHHARTDEVLAAIEEMSASLSRPAAPVSAPQAGAPTGNRSASGAAALEPRSAPA